MPFIYIEKYTIFLHTADVQKAMKFATKHHLPVSIVSTKHGFLGRQATENTFHISMINFKELSVDVDESTLTTGTGNVFRDIYTEVMYSLYFDLLS